MHFHKAYDGGAKLFEYLAEQLVKMGHEVIFVTTPVKEEKLTKIKKVKYNGVEYVFLPVNYHGKRLSGLNVPYKLLFSYKLVKYLENIDFDVIHSSEAFALFYLMKNKKNRRPVVTQCYGLEPFYGPESLSQRGLKKLYVKIFLQLPWLFCLRKSDTVASEGEFQTHDLEKLGVSKNKILPIPNGLYLEGIKNYEKNYENKRKSHGMKKNDFVILNVNQIAPDKRVEDIVDAFYLLKKEVKNAKLIIIGKGILEEKIHGMIKSKNLQDDVIHLKNIPEKELYDYYFSSDVFVNASIQSDYIMGIQEAMACGLPTVSSRQPFLVKDDVNGYVVGARNPNGLKGGLLKIFKSSKQKLKKMKEDAKKMAEKYDYRNIAKTALKEYEKLILKRNSTR